MEITLMSSTNGMGNKLWNINLMDYITQTLKKMHCKIEKCLQKALRDRKKFTRIEGKSWKRS